MYSILASYLYKFVCCTQNFWYWCTSRRPIPILTPIASSSEIPGHCLGCSNLPQNSRTWIPTECSLSTSKRPPFQCHCLQTKNLDLFSSPNLPDIAWWHWRWRRPGVRPPFGRSLPHQSSSSCRCPKSSSGRCSSPSLVRRIRRTCPRCSRILKGFVLVTAGGNIDENIGLRILPKVRPAFFIRIQCLAASAPASASAREMLALRGVSWAWGNVEWSSEQYKFYI